MAALGQPAGGAGTASSAAKLCEPAASSAVQVLPSPARGTPAIQSMFAGAAGQIQEDGSLIYRCTQGALFIKRSENPESQKVLKLKRAAGAYIHATGYTWTGPGGGVWAELEASKGEMGWALVRGPGFGLDGPALIDASDLLEATSLRIVLADQEPGVIFHSWVRLDMTILELKKIVADATGLERKSCCLIKDPPAKIPGTQQELTADYCEDLKDPSTLASLGCGDTTQLYLMYLSDFPTGFQRPKPLLLT